MDDVLQPVAASGRHPKSEHTGRYFVELGACAAGYFGLALLGLKLASAAPQVSLVWPVSGAALALLLLRGTRLWPAIAAGALAANLVSGAPFAAAIGISLGNTLEGLLGASIAARMGLQPGLRRRHDVLTLLGVVAPLAPIVAAALGVVSLSTFGAESWGNFGHLWFSWWLGDALGILIVAPFVLTWIDQARRGWRLTRSAEAAVLGIILILLSMVVFSTAGGRYPVHYLTFPAVIWSAMRLGQHATASIALGAALIATVATLAGRGPFVYSSGHLSLLHAELFMAVIAATGLVLGAAMAERNRAERESKRVAEAITETARQLTREHKRKDEFLTVLAHELRNPLAPLQNAVTLLARAPTNTAVVAQAQGVLERQLRHLVRLVDDLLDLARIRSGKILLAPKPIVLANAIRDAVEMAQPMVTAHKHDLRVHLPDQPITLEGDPTRLPQLIANLLNNAAKYTPAGGRIDLEARAEESRVTIRVRDSGIGMTADTLGEVFELFSQARTAHTIEGGLGVGLSVARALANLHGGTLEAHSEGPGRGSEFILQLPLKPPTGQESAQQDGAGPKSPALGSTAGLRVLVCDDNVDATDTLVALLRSMGYEACAAYEGGSALGKANEFRPDVMVVDLGMPGLDGYAVAEAVRNDVALTGVRLVALSGYGQPEHRKRTAEAGFDVHLVKPVDIELLVAALRRQ
ncbi:MAG TPA: MASE1 domain-containing protein [Steroidobacteraceae bacterium]|nr:MASE1 domain-containing protein [Steroidobacteraceae bacterium]